MSDLHEHAQAPEKPKDGDLIKCSCGYVARYVVLDGCWGGCICGWKSHTWTTTVGVHLEFGTHLTEDQP